MCRNPDELVGSKRIKDNINVANGAAVPVVAAGALNLDADVAGRCSGITLSGTICVPDLAINLLSVSQICKKGHEVVFTSKICKVINCENGEVVAIGVESDGLYQLKQVNRAIACMTTAEDELMLWHRRLGHMNSQSMKILSRMSTGVSINCGELSPCVPCIKGKHQRLPFKRTGTRAEEVLELVHTDLCGPMESNSIGGNKYFLTFIDDASRRTIVYFLRSKKEVLEAFKDYKAQAENQTGRKIKRLRSDNGKEYVGRDFEDFLRSSGIIHETTVPYNPEQNGLAERRNRTIVEKARALLFDAGLDKRFWAEAVGTAVYLMNRSPAKGLTCTPEEQFTGKRPDLSHLRVFGAKAMAHVPKVKRQKWDPKSEACVFVGYATNAKGYRLYNPTTRKFLISRDVIFLCEKQQPTEGNEREVADLDRVEFYTQGVVHQVQDRPANVVQIEDSDSDTDTDGYETVAEDLDETVRDSALDAAEETVETRAVDTDAVPGEDRVTPAIEELAEANAVDADVDPVAGPSSALPPQLQQSLSGSVMRRSERERRLPGKYNDFKVTYSMYPQKTVSQQHGSRGQQDGRATALPSHPTKESVGAQHDSKSGDWERQIKGKCPDTNLNGEPSLQLIIPQPAGEPCTFRDAMNRTDREFWIEAMDSEYQALMENKTWTMTMLPAGRKALKNKWVYKIKVKSDGSIERYKARLVIKGCSQVEGVDYNETYSPVVRYATIRYLMSKAAELSLEIHQMDAVTAFLQGDLGEEQIFMQQPEGFEDGTERVCLLKKALYGLKQASRVWNLKLDKELRRMGLQRSKYDTCVYFRITEGKMVIVTIYVDDFLIFSNDDEMVSTVKSALTKKFRMKDLGMAKQVLGIRVTRGNGTVAVDQERYINELLEKFKMTECNPVLTPMDLNQKLSREMSPRTEEDRERMKQVPFRELIGSLQFLAQCTRPDICHALSVVSSFCENPGDAHWVAAKRILRYLKGTKDLKLVYSKQSENRLDAFTDADWGNDLDTRRSTSGYVFIKNGGAITWSSRRQPTVALSTTEAEYMALAATTQESIWWRGFIGELWGQKLAMLIRCDNKSAISLAEKEMGYSPRSKHIDIRHHFVREQIEMKCIKLLHVSSEQQVADVLTKAVPAPKLSEARRSLGVHKI